MCIRIFRVFLRVARRNEGEVEARRATPPRDRSSPSEDLNWIAKLVAAAVDYMTCRLWDMGGTGFCLCLLIAPVCFVALSPLQQVRPPCSPTALRSINGHVFEAKASKLDNVGRPARYVESR